MSSCASVANARARVFDAMRVTIAARISKAPPAAYHRAVPIGIWLTVEFHDLASDQSSRIGGPS